MNTKIRDTLRIRWRSKNVIRIVIDNRHERNLKRISQFINSTMTHEKSFIVRVAPDTMIRRESGSIVGHIWIDIEEWSFPGASWDDFPVVILGWWIEALLPDSFPKSPARCNFMDGPYWFEISAPIGQVATVRFFERSATESNLLREESLRFIAIIEAISSAARTVIDACNKHHWTSIDLKNLVSLYSNLRNRYPQ